ncbi:MAG: hypothetical protein AABX89_07530 [Candidatus Thermoplasmatota archaeon]
MRSVAPLFLALLILPAASAHNPSEANELEILLIEDEGTDAVEAYGGYDINSVYLGLAHDASVGAGEAGDGFYLRAELYGLRSEQVVPSPPGQEEWRITFFFEGGDGPTSRYLATTDGTTFTTDFDALFTELEEEFRETHVIRAFVSFASTGLAPGDTLRGLRLESTVGGDLRDLAPGGIPLPYTDGAAAYPAQAAGSSPGTVEAEPVLGAPSRYLSVTRLDVSAGTYTIAVQSTLKQSGQHIHIAALDGDGWNLTYATPRVLNVPAGGEATFTFQASPNPGAANLALEIVTDVGGRLPIFIEPDGTIQAAGLSQDAPALSQVAPAVGPVLFLGLLALAVAMRRR